MKRSGTLIQADIEASSGRRAIVVMRVVMKEYRLLLMVMRYLLLLLLYMNRSDSGRDLVQLLLVVKVGVLHHEMLLLMEQL